MTDETRRAIEDLALKFEKHMRMASVCRKHQKYDEEETQRNKANDLAFQIIKHARAALAAVPPAPAQAKFTDSEVDEILDSLDTSPRLTALQHAVLSSKVHSLRAAGGAHLTII